MIEDTQDVAASATAASGQLSNGPYPLQTTYKFTLPKGYVDNAGGVHREGMMRLAVARDELLALNQDDRVKTNENYLAIVLLTRVITSLGNLPQVHSGIIENLFVADLAYLQDLYKKINFDGIDQPEETTGSGAPARDRLGESGPTQ